MAVTRYPEAEAKLRRLVLTAQDFREICEEFAFTQQSLARFAERPDAAKPPEIGDNRTVTAVLEIEIDRFLKGDVSKS